MSIDMVVLTIWTCDILIMANNCNNVPEASSQYAVLALRKCKYKIRKHTYKFKKKNHLDGPFEF